MPVTGILSINFAAKNRRLTARSARLIAKTKSKNFKDLIWN